MDWPLRHSTPPTAREPAPAPIKLLLISDLLLMRAGLRHLLEREAAGISIIGDVSTCDEALSAAAREPPDVILVDLDSQSDNVDLDSQSDNFECVRHLVSAHPDARVIALSDRRRTADHPRLLEFGAVGLVLKHERPEVLIKAIRKVHAGEAWLDRVHTAQVLMRIARRRQSQDVEATKIATLTGRERQIIGLVGEGLKNAAIAERLFISEATVRNHLTSILDKLDLSDRFELAVYAFRRGLVRYPHSSATEQQAR
jgi:two-component system, NarL family, nitrate/nitrite response regulator NarL